MTEVSPARPPTSRADRMAAAVEDWADQLAGLGGRSTLLHFRDLKVGTLDLAAADAEARRRLVEGHPTPVSRLFPHEPLRSSATRSARAVRDKAHELADERGLHCCYLAVGIATWSEPFAARRPTAPVLLRPARVTQVGGGGDDLLVTVSSESRVNPVLLRSMADQLGLRIEPGDLLDAAGDLRYPVVVEKLREFAPPHVVDGFSVAHRAVLGTFGTTAWSMRDDVVGAAGHLASHDVVAALAGDPDALASLGTRRTTVSGSAADATAVVDADAGQEAAVRAAMTGDAVVLGPPGTGATQTVTNLVASLARHGRTALVVAARRDDAAALARRLEQVGLGDVVLDAVDGAARAELVARLAAPVEAAAQGAGVDAADPAAAGEDAARRAAAVAAHRDTMHRPREPWGISAYAAQAAVAGSDPGVRCTTRLDAATIGRLHGDGRAAVRASLREYADLGGLSLGPDDSPWYGARPTGPADARAAGDLVVRLRDRGLPELRDVATRAAVEVGLPGPTSPGEALDAVALVDRAAELLGTFRPAVWAADLDDLVDATADRSWRRTHGSTTGWLGRRRVRATAGELLRDPAARPERATLHRYLDAALALRQEWVTRARDSKPPRVGIFHDAARETAAEVRDGLAALAALTTRASDVVDASWAEAHRRLALLAADEQTLLTLPRLHDLESSLEAAGLAPLVEELRGRRADAATALGSLDHAWHASLLSLWRERDPSYGEADPEALDAQVDAFRHADLVVQDAAAAAVRRSYAERVAAALEEHPGQAALLEAQRSVSAPVRGIGDLVRAAPDVALAVKPCWVVSPYTVPDLLPPQRLFDVVVVLGAGAIRPAEVVPALLRGESAVLVGGSHERVLRPFSVPVEQDQVDDDEQAPPPVASVLEALGPHLPVHELSWHHASRDERLLAFVNRRVLGGRLVSTPAAAPDPQAVRHVLVEGRADAADPVDSVGAEVGRVVELVVQHAHSRPYESLAVVTLGAHHAHRVETGLRAALSRAPGLDAFFADAREEPFVVSDLGRPPVSARDAVILSLGHGRTVDGRVLYRFGALAHPGGDRRLAAVLARARARLTVVSSLSWTDLNERRLTSEGALVLRDLLAYVEGGARDTGGLGSDVADPLEAAVHQRLREAGVSVVPHAGASSRRVGLALRHPGRPGRFVIAVDTDGPAWAASGSVRDSARLVPEELERRGWRTHRVWSAAWAADPDREVRRLLRAYEQAVEEADTYDAAVSAAVNDAVVGPPDDAVESARSAGEERAARPRGERPAARAGRDVGGYALVELVALARWVESDARLRTEGEAAAEVARELHLDADSPRVDQRLRHAVRAARAAGGAPGLDEPEDAEDLEGGRAPEDAESSATGVVLGDADGREDAEAPETGVVLEDPDGQEDAEAPGTGVVPEDADAPEDTTSPP